MPKGTSFDSIENMAVFLLFMTVGNIFMRNDGQLCFLHGMGTSKKRLAQPQE